MSSATPKKRKGAPEAHPERKEKRSKFVNFNNQKPISLNFQPRDNGLIIAKAPGVEPPSDLTFTAYAKEGRKRRKLHLHSASHPRLDFTAPSIPRQAPHGKEIHYLGVFDPETNELQMIPTETVKMASNLKKAFEPKGGNSDTEDEDERVQKPERSYYERREDLGEAFGTKKAKKALKSAAANAVGGSAKSNVPLPITAMTEAVVENAKDALDEEINGKEELTELVLAAHPRPKPNIEAEVPADIYKLDRVIPWSELQVVDVTGWMSAISGGASVKTSSRFTGGRVLKIIEQKNKIKTRALKYLYAMMCWYNALVPKGKDGSKGLPPKDKMEAAMPGIDSYTRDNIRRRFMPKNGTRLSPWDVNKIILHMCAMAIVLDDCITEVHDLQEDLKLTAKEIRNYYQELGCTVRAFKEDKSQQVAELKLPFSLPEVRQRRMIRR